MDCPNCQSHRTRRGGNTIWSVYIVLIAAALIAVLVFGHSAALAAGVMIAVIIIAHLVLDQRVCLECGHQWKG